jgi:hypothetical protein
MAELIAWADEKILSLEPLIKEAIREIAENSA